MIVMTTPTLPTSSEARELSLVSKLELRIALADTDAKLQALLQTYLAPLLLKLGSDSLTVRNKVIAVCQHINARIQPQSIQIPVLALLKQFKEQEAQLIRHFDLSYIQQGIDRIDPIEQANLLPIVLRGISDLNATSEQGANVFNLLLRLLPCLRLPEKDSLEDAGLREKLGLSTRDAQFLSSSFANLFLFKPGGDDTTTCPGLSASEYYFLNAGRGSPKETWDPSAKGGLNLMDTKATVGQFIASGAFTDMEKFIPAVVLSVDTNSRLSEIGDDILKKFHPDLEDSELVERLYKLYFGAEGSYVALPAPPPLQVKILVLLGKSVKATTYTSRIIQLLDDGLFSDTAKFSTGLQATKLRTQIFTFTTWVIRMGLLSDLNVIAPKAILGLIEFVRSQGWPNPKVKNSRSNLTSLDLRALAYESLGMLASKLDPSIHRNDPDSLNSELLHWLFQSLSLDNSGPTISVTIEQALGSILNSFTAKYKEAPEWLCTLLTRQMGTRPGEEDASTGYKVVRSTHFAAVRFANRCLPYGDVWARWIDIMAIGASAGDERQEIAEEGRKGLHPYWYRMFNPIHVKSAGAAPTGFEQDSRYSFPPFERLAVVLHVASDLVLGQIQASSEGLYAPAVSFVRRILLNEAFTAAGISVEVDQEWEHRLDALLLSNETARSAVRTYIRDSRPEVIQLLLDNAFCGFLINNSGRSDECGTHFADICSLASNAILSPLAKHAIRLKNCLFSNNHVTQNIAARAIGMLASHPSFAEKECLDFLNQLRHRIESWRTVFGQAANHVRGAILAIAYLLSRLAYRKRLDLIPDEQVKGYIHTVLDVFRDTRDSRIREAAQISLGQLSLSGILNQGILREACDWKMVKDKLLEDAKREQEIPISTLGLLSLMARNDADDDTVMFGDILDSLYSLHEIRKPEVQLAVGESLSIVAVGWKSNALMAAFDVDEERSESNYRPEILADIADRIIASCGMSKPSLRKASAIWLLCLVKDCGHVREIQERLRRCQAAFTGLLTDRDEVVQEFGSRGLGLVYEMGNQGLKDDLARDLVHHFTGNNTSLGGGHINQDTELFEPGTLPTGERSSITTYKDIISLASEVGDPSLVYRFMSLASNNAIWSSRAAFGRFGLSNILSDSSLNGYLARNPKIYPKLYRYRFDPNPSVQRSMNDIWQAIVKDSSATIDTHFDTIIDDLLSSILAGREWRVREASCAALADLIQGSKLEKYDKYMPQILTKAFKVLDDIKGTVRDAALKLCRAITSIVTRSLEAGDLNPKQAKTMLEHILPFLLSREGLESSVVEVQKYAISTLINIIKKSPAKLLRPFAPKILEKFLGSLSSLEPQALNYIHLNADKYGLSGQEIDKMRLSSIHMSPMMEAIERYLLDSLDEDSMKEVASKLEHVLRSAVGLPSKVGCSRVLAILSKQTLLFQPYADRFIQLLKRHVLDRNDTVSVSYSASIGYLMHLATDDRALDTIEFAIRLYFTAEDVSHRAISGEIIHSMSKLSSDRFTAFATTALPFVFVAKHDSDEQIRELFDRTWQENVGGSRAVSLYLKEILNLASDHLDSQLWVIKHTSALAIADMITCLEKNVCVSSAELIWPVLEKALAGKSWDGKEMVLKALVIFATHTKDPWQARSNVGGQMKAIIIREAKRKNPTYRPHALGALGDFAEIRGDLCPMPEALSIVTSVVEELTAISENKTKTDSNSHDGTPRSEETLAACVSCLIQCIDPMNQAAATGAPFSEVSAVIETAFQGGSRLVQTTLYNRLEALLSKLQGQISNQDREPLALDMLEPFLTELAGRLLFCNIDSTIETNRSKRAQAAEEYILICRQAGFPLDEHVRRSVTAWLGQERSSSIQHTLNRALQKLQEEA